MRETVGHCISPCRKALRGDTDAVRDGSIRLEHDPPLGTLIAQGDRADSAPTAIVRALLEASA